MAISKFKITRAPKRALIKIEGVDYVLNQEYAIHLQSAMQILVDNIGEPYDNFGFKLGNPNNTWSQEYNATINALVDVGTPFLANLDISVKGNEVTDITSLIIFDDYTDRFKVVQLSPNYGAILINDSQVVLNKTYMLYDIDSIDFSSNHTLIEQNIVTTMTCAVGNKDGWVANSTINLISSANMTGSSDSVITVTGTLTAA